MTSFELLQDLAKQVRHADYQTQEALRAIVERLIRKMEAQEERQVKIEAAFERMTKIVETAISSFVNDHHRNQVIHDTAQKLIESGFPDHAERVMTLMTPPACLIGLAGEMQALERAIRF